MSDEHRKETETVGLDRTGNPTRLMPRLERGREALSFGKNGVVSRGTRSKAIRSLKTPSMTS